MTDELGIVVTGQGAVASVPDTVWVTLGVSVKAVDAPTALASAAAAASTLNDALIGAGVEPGDIRTVNYSIHQEYRHTSDGAVADGYRVTNTVVCDVHDPSTTGSVIDAAATAAGDAIEVQGISFGRRDDTEQRDAARAAAFADALRSATQLAELAGRRLGAAEWIREVPTSGDHRPPGAMLRLAASDATTPIAPGEQVTRVAVDVRFGFSG